MTRRGPENNCLQTPATAADARTPLWEGGRPAGASWRTPRRPATTGFRVRTTEFAIGVLLVLAGLTGRAGAVTLEPVASGFSSPLHATTPGDGSGRIFVVERGGTIRVLGRGASTSTLFLDISGRVLSGGERGLLGLAFHPDFPADDRFFVNYTRTGDGATIISSFRLAGGVGDPSSETELLAVAQPFANHNGGMVEFGPDGFLYVALGDGGSANDPADRAQNLSQLLGKILRIDVDVPAGSDPPYTSPPSNPFVGVPGRDEIWAYGLRNPWRFSFDRETGDLVAGDVGQNAIEEIDEIVRGGNYGWRVFEGTPCTGNDPEKCDDPGFLFPIAEYAHENGRCSVTGGYVYRGRAGTLPQGTYVFGDFCSGEIFVLENGQPTVLLDTDRLIASFGEDENGEILVVGLGGTVERISGGITCAGRAVTIPGTPDADVIRGTSGADVIHGLAGADDLRGGGGDDVICGGSGNDTLIGNLGDDLLAGNDGDDSLFGAADDDVVHGGSGADVLVGGPGNDRLRGGLGEDRLLGKGGNDDVGGGAQADVVQGSAGDDLVDGSGGNDTVLGGPGNDVILGGDGNDLLRGGDGIDTCDGGPGENDLAGCER